NNEIVFPDLSFENSQGDVVHLELFHRWHMSAVVKRLEPGGTEEFPNLIIGVDRGLIKKGNLKEEHDCCSRFDKRGVLYRDVPT
ncbi:MAG: hypothetical protein HRT88_15165, partial [Lentisphaeraceae bacterium]|nr:hypothetical protein [Lentisphaeraceae bacterium]